MRKWMFLIVLCLNFSAFAQNKIRPLTVAEYEKAKQFTIKNLDNDSYVKFDNQYILDRYESKKPYFITGDDGFKKRIDLYKLIAKDSLQEIGVYIFYTTENGKLYKACMPSYISDAKVWEKYFEDIHAIDKEEKNFVLKLSYLLSKEFCYQAYKFANAGKDISREAGTYGSDICFPGNTKVTMADGSVKQLQSIKAGDEIITVNPVTKQATTATVQALSVHVAKNYAITNLLLIHTDEQQNNIILLTKEIEATPNHPLLTKNGEKKIGNIAVGDEILCLNELSHSYEAYKVWIKTEQPKGVQSVYNIVANGGTTFMMNNVMMLQKPLQK